MDDYPIFLFTALLIFGFGLISKKSSQSIITAPMVFVAVGFLASFSAIDFLHNGLRAPFLKVIAELTLALILFSDASAINLKSLIRERGIPFRLLMIGLPLTMILGILIALPLFPGLGIWTIALMALILSPTDAALGQAVVTSRLIPEKIRQGINVESGLNDGIALPPILLCIAALTESAGGPEAELDYWLLFTLKQLLFGPLIGIAVGWLGGKAIDVASRKGWMNETFQRLSSLALAIMAFSLAGIVSGNGFIAAFFAGLLLGIKTPEIKKRVQEFGEAEGQALELFIFLLFGMLLVPMAAPFWDINAWLYALLSLTLIRMLPVTISLWGTKLPWQTVSFIGWFGPRGIASVLYLLIVLISLGTKGYEKIMAVIVLTVLLSIFLHGISSTPLSAKLGKFEKKRNT